MTAAADVQVVLVTAPDLETARGLARALVEERLAACVNLLPGLRSIYRWQGAIEEEEEILLVLKTRKGIAPQLEARVAELHPYDVPEVLCLGVSSGHAPYLDWVVQETRS